MKSIALVALALALLAVLYVSRPRASACSGTPYCTGAWVFPVGGPFESDRFAITYYSEERAVDGGVRLPRLTRVVDGGVVDVPFETLPVEQGRLKLTPLEVQPVGATIRLETDQSSYCSSATALSEEYEITAPQPRPRTLGSLLVRVGREMLPLGIQPDFSCFALVDAVVADLSVQLDTEAAQHATHYIYELFVDGVQHAS